jgi:hypothetical protein
MGTLGRVRVGVAIAVIAGAGLCPYDADDTATGDLCSSAFATTGGLLFAVPLVLSGRFLPAVALASHLYHPDLPTPPP